MQELSHWLLPVWGLWPGLVLRGWGSRLLSPGRSRAVQVLQCQASPSSYFYYGDRAIVGASSLCSWTLVYWWHCRNSGHQKGLSPGQAAMRLPNLCVDSRYDPNHTASFKFMVSRCWPGWNLIKFSVDRMYSLGTHIWNGRRIIWFYNIHP